MQAYLQVLTDVHCDTMLLEPTLPMKEPVWILFATIAETLDIWCSKWSSSSTVSKKADLDSKKTDENFVRDGVFPLIRAFFESVYQVLELVPVCSLSPSTRYWN